MTHGQVWLRGLGTWVPDTRHSIEAAVETGLYDEARAFKDKFTSIAVEPVLFPVDMALKAGRVALANIDPKQIDRLVYTSIHRHGHKTLWPPASFLHRELALRSDATAFSLSQGCNGAFVALQLAIEQVRSRTAASVMVIGSDRFEETAFDRWNSDHGTVYGDAASAVVVSSVPGIARILHFDLEQGTALERMYRDERPRAESDDGVGVDYDVGAAKRAYLAQHGDAEVREVFAATLGTLRKRLLASHRLDQDPAQHVIFPNVGAGISARFYQEQFGPLAMHDAWEYGRSIGHTGVSDQLLGLADLISRGVTKPGDRVLLVGAGNGLSAGLMLVELAGDSTSELA